MHHQVLSYMYVHKTMHQSSNVRTSTYRTVLGVRSDAGGRHLVLHHCEKMSTVLVHARTYVRTQYCHRNYTVHTLKYHIPFLCYTSALLSYNLCMCMCQEKNVVKSKPRNKRERSALSNFIPHLLFRRQIKKAHKGRRKKHFYFTVWFHYSLTVYSTGDATDKCRRA